jgi:tape measure domain-containing protein
MALGNDTQIASISIGSSLDLTGFDRDLANLKRQMQSSVPSIVPHIDIAPALAAFKELQSEAAKFKPIKFGVDTSGFESQFRKSSESIAKLQSDVLKAQGQLAKGSGDLGTQKESALLQEVLRYQQQIARIDASPFSADDLAKAKQMAAELNSMNVDRINQQFQKLAQSSATAIQGMSGQATAIQQEYKSAAGAIAQLEQQLLKAKGVSAKSSGDVAEQREIAVLQEIARYKEVIGKINASPFSPQDIERANRMAQELRDINLGNINTQFNRLEAEAAEATKKMDQFGAEAVRSAHEAGAGFIDLKGIVSSFVGNLASNLVSNIASSITNAIASAIDAVKNFTGESIQKYQDLAGLSNALTLVEGSSEKATQSLAFVRAEAERLGAPIATARDGFVRLAAAARGTKLAESTAQIFDSVTQASRVYQLSNDDYKGSILAIEQMISKGKISAEELRGQLGERLPGAFQIAARAMGVTTAQLDKMLQTGSVLAEDFLPKFAKQLASETAGGLPGALKTSQSAMVRVQNAVTDIQEELGKAIEPALAAGLNLVGDSLSKLKDLGAFDEINRQAQEFANYIKDNPQLVDQTAEAFRTLASGALDISTKLAKDMLETLKQNPHAMEDLVDASKGFVGILQASLPIIEKIVAGFAAITSGLGGTKDAYSQKIEALGGDSKELDRRVSELLATDQYSSRFLGFGPRTYTQDQANRARADATSQYEQELRANPPATATASGQAGGDNTVELLVNSLKQSEGFRDHVYDDGLGNATIGYGDTSPVALAMGTITEPQAAAMLEKKAVNEYLMPALAELPAEIVAQLTPGMKAAIGSLTYNMGLGNFTQTRVFENLRSGNFQAAGDAIPTTITEGGLLDERRAAERELFFTRSTAPSSSTSVATTALADRPETPAEARARVFGTVTSQPDAADVHVEPRSVTLDAQNYGASRDGGSRQHAGQDLDVSGADALAYSYLGGRVVSVNRSDAASGEGSYGNYVEVYNSELKIVERIAEAAQILDGIEVGSIVQPGQAVGKGESESGVFHYELRNDADSNGIPQGSGFTGTVNPLEYYRSHGIDPLKGIIPGAQLNRTGVADTSDEEKKRQEEAAREQKRILEQARKDQDEATRMRRENEKQEQELKVQQQRQAIESTAAPFQGTDLEGIFSRQLEDFDRAEKYNAKIREETQSIEDLQIARDRLAQDRKNDPTAAAQIKVYDDSIAKRREYIQGLQQQRNAEQATIDTQRKAAADRALLQQQLDRQQQERQLESETNSLRLQQQMSQITDSEASSIISPIQSAAESFSRYGQQIDEQLAKKKQLEASLQAIESVPNVNLNDPEIQQIEGELAGVNSQIDHLKENQQIEIDISLNQSQQAFDQYFQDINDRVVQAQTQYLTNRGDTFGANQVQRQYAIAEEQRRYALQSIGIDQIASTGNRSAEEIDALRQKASELNSLTLDKIRSQFKDLGQTINATAGQAFGGFLSEALSAPDKIGQAFDRMADSILQSLGQILSQLAMKELQYLFNPKPKAASTGGGLLDTVFGGISSLIGGGSGDIFSDGAKVAGLAGGFGDVLGFFAEGGPIPGYYNGRDDEHIARVNPGEFIFSRKAVKAIGVPTLNHWNSLTKLPAFAEGGYVSPGRFDRVPGYRSESEGAGRSGGQKIDVSYTVKEIAGQRYITEEEFRSGIEQAARLGAREGHKTTMNTLKDSVGARRSVGL